MNEANDDISPVLDRWFLALKVIILTFCSFGLLFGLYNVYSFLYLRKKYKVLAKVFIYICAILCILLNGAYAIIVPISDFCNVWWFMTAYTAAYCDLGVGICQCYLLTMLSQ